MTSNLRSKNKNGKYTFNQPGCKRLKWFYLLLKSNANPYPSPKFNNESFPAKKVHKKNIY